jgi:hypothetical protein
MDGSRNMARLLLELDLLEIRLGYAAAGLPSVPTAADKSRKRKAAKAGAQVRKKGNPLVHGAHHSSTRARSKSGPELSQIGRNNPNKAKAIATQAMIKAARAIRLARSAASAASRAMVSIGSGMAHG